MRGYLSYFKGCMTKLLAVRVSIDYRPIGHKEAEGVHHCSSLLFGDVLAQAKYAPKLRKGKKVGPQS